MVINTALQRMLIKYKTNKKNHIKDRFVISFTSIQRKEGNNFIFSTHKKCFHFTLSIYTKS